MQSFCDLETDQMTAARLGAAAPTPAPAPRESWLDRLARKLAPIPVDHMPIVPAHAHAELTAHASVPRPSVPACCACTA